MKMTQNDIDFLIKNYPIYGKKWCMDKLKISIAAKKRIKEKGHPRGMLGKKMSDDNKKKLIASVKAIWDDPNHRVNSDEYRQIISDRSSKRMSMQKNNSNMYSRGKRGTVEIGEKTFFARSSWEANIAAYLEFQKTHGIIKDWFHEPETFWFLNIKRGVRSYLPDFKVIKNDDTFYFIEVKGYMDAKSKTKMKRLAKYYPEIELQLIDQKRYNEIKKSKGLFKGWGALDGK